MDFFILIEYKCEEVIEVSHLFVAIFTYGVFLLGTGLDSVYRWSCLVVSVIATMMYLRSWYDTHKIKINQTAMESKTCPKEQLSVVEGLFRDCFDGYVSVLPDYTHVRIQTEEGLMLGFCDNQYLIDKMKNHSGKLKVYHYHAFIVDVEIIESIDEAKEG